MAAESYPFEMFSGTATGDGVWKDVGQFNAPWSVVFTGTFGTDSLEVRVSNANPKPADNTHGVIFGAAVVAEGKVVVTDSYKWAKVRKTAGTANIVAAAHAQLLHG